MTCPAGHREPQAGAGGEVRPFPGSGQGVLTTSGGERLPVRTFERGREVVLVVLVDVDEAPSGEAGEADLEYTSTRGVVRLHGRAVFEDRSLVRFRADGEPEVVQRRSFVRVHTPQAVTLQTQDGARRRVSTVDLSGGGMLLAGAEILEPGQNVGFAIALGGDAPIEGEARVVRVDGRDRRALVFERIGEHDRQRLIRYVFECMRRARARTRGDWL